METLVLALSILLPAVTGAAIGFVIIKVFVTRAKSFALCSIGFAGSVILAFTAFIAVIAGGVGTVIDALNPKNLSPYVMFGGAAVFLIATILFGASIGGFIAALMKTSSINR